MQGQLILALIMGVLVYLGLTVLGVKHALLLAVIAAVFEIIPVFGPTLAAVPAILIGFVDGGFPIGIAVILLYIIFQQFENHLIYPLVVTRVVGVPPLLVILGLIIGETRGIPRHPPFRPDGSGVAGTRAGHGRPEDVCCCRREGIGYVHGKAILLDDDAPVCERGSSYRLRA